MPDHAETLRRLLLRVPNRRRVHDAIVATPGTHARRLSRDLGMALGVVEHHVRVLERHDVVYAHRSGRRRGLFASGAVSAVDAAILHGLRKQAWRDVAVALLDGERSVSDLSRRFGEPPTSVSYRLRRMRDAGLLDNLRVGRESVYLLRDPEAVRRVIARHFCPAPDDGFVALVQRARRRADEATAGLIVPTP